MLIGLALRSLANRRGTALLTIVAIAMAVSMLLGVEKVRNETRASFLATVSGIDLIVGARTGSVQLLLSSVFHIGNASNNVSRDSYQRISRHPLIAWSVPISLGDSHRGFPVVGTTDAYFEHVRHGRGQPLQLASGRRFEGPDQAVIGARVASELDYRVGDTIVLAHGAGPVSFQQHSRHPITVSGILSPTGTPIDRTVHISLEAVDRLHETAAHASDADHDRSTDDAPESITAFFLGIRDPAAILTLQRAINEYKREPLTAIVPAVALQALWDLIAIAESALLVVSAAVVVTGMLGMLTVILASLNERRRELAILRSVGAGTRHITALLLLEALIYGLAGTLLGTALTYAGLALGADAIEARWGLRLAVGVPQWREIQLLLAVVATAVVAGIIPALRAWRMSVADGLTVKT